MNATAIADDYLQLAIEAAGARASTALDALPVPVYVTDPDGLVTYSNRACAEFAGREPEPGKDRWCVTWRLFTTSGDPLPHERCPMAEALQQEQEVRGAIAIALRPDGRRLAFTPFPTPLFDAEGHLTGGVNMLVDITEQQRDVLEQQASRCRRLSRSTNDREASDVLDAMAAKYQETASALAAR